MHASAYPDAVMWLHSRNAISPNRRSDRSATDVHAACPARDERTAPIRSPIVAKLEPQRDLPTIASWREMY